MSKGVKEIDKGVLLTDSACKVLAPYDPCAVCAKLASLQAKVYVYEKIIANSNFSPMVQDKTKEEKHKAQWTILTLVNSPEQTYALACSYCSNELMSFVGYKDKEEARRAARDGIECGSIKAPKYCSCCGARMGVDI